MLTQGAHFAGWLIILVGVWLPWSHRVQVQTPEEVYNEGSTRFGMDSYQGWVMLWLPLAAMTAGAFATSQRRSVRWSQLAVGLMVFALALHLILRPDVIGNGSRLLIGGGGILGVLDDAVAVRAAWTLGPGLFWVLVGAALFCKTSLIALLWGREGNSADEALSAPGP